jgi:ketol-acid reductoisomerase
MARIYYDADTKLEPLLKKKVAVLGYGSQGRAHALNLRDSGVEVVVGLRKGGRSWDAAVRDGFRPEEISEACRKADVIMVLLPDTAHKAVYEKEVAPSLKAGKAIAFAHGYSVRFGLVNPPKDVDVFMVAPKSPGIRVRETYSEGFGVPALVAVQQDATGKAEELALAYAKGIGATKAGALETTFLEETETDLFGEQTVLVGGVMSLIEKGYEVLTEAGYQPESAYFEVCNELKLIMDMIYRGGFEGMLRAVSDTAKYGGLTRGYVVVDDHVKANMKKALEDIQDGTFAREWTGDLETSLKRLDAMMEEMKAKDIERVGRSVRRLAGVEK